MLRLDDYTLAAHALNVGIVMPLKDEDASGESSSTAVAKKGNKAKKLEVRCQIKKVDEDDLRELMRVAEAVENGDSKVYTLTNTTANAAGMRQAKFTGQIRADESEVLRLWEVSFTLLEHISVPEMAEQRQGGRPSATQKNTGGTIGTGGEEDTAEAKDKNMSTIEKVLKWLDGQIGPEGE